MQLVFEGSKVKRLNLPKRGGRQEVSPRIQMSNTKIQAVFMVIILLARNEYLITMALSTAITKTVTMLTRAVLTVRKPRLLQTCRKN